jgi:predicted kinase
MAIKKASVYLIHGFIGSGKTTFSKALAKEKCAMRLNPDELMITLHGNNPPADQFGAYYDRVQALIWQLTAELLAIDVPVILDFGFWTKKSRQDAINRVIALGGAPSLYSIECDPKIMKERCLQRSQSLSGGDLYIDEAAFDKFYAMYEPLGDDEERIAVSAKR